MENESILSVQLTTATKLQGEKPALVPNAGRILLEAVGAYK